MTEKAVEDQILDEYAKRGIEPPAESALADLVARVERGERTIEDVAAALDPYATVPGDGGDPAEVSPGDDDPSAGTEITSAPLALGDNLSATADAASADAEIVDAVIHAADCANADCEGECNNDGEEE